MSSVIDLFTKTKAQRDEEKRARQFLRMFAEVSHILDISKGVTTESDIVEMLEKLGKIGMSSDVFIAIVLIIHSKRKQLGFITLMRIGNLIQSGSNENVLKTIPNKSLESIFKSIQFITEDVEMYLTNVPDEIAEEPLELFHSFRRHVLHLSGMDKSRFNLPKFGSFKAKPKHESLVINVNEKEVERKSK